jgi:hypothetical protein
MACAKISALLLYLRASRGTKYKRFVWLTILVVALWGIGSHHPSHLQRSNSW